MHHLVTSTLHKSPTKKIDVVVGLDARGFLLGPVIALRLGAAFVPVRKAGKLPGATEKVEYEKEYGSDFFEVRYHLFRQLSPQRADDGSRSTQMQKDAIKPGQTCIVIDDLIATGGSALAAGELIKKLGGKTLEYLFLIELTFLKGTQRLDAESFSIVKSDD